MATAAMSAEAAVVAHKKRTLQVFLSNLQAPIPEDFEVRCICVRTAGDVLTPLQSQKAKLMVKILDEYRTVKDLPPPAPSKPAAPAPAAAAASAPQTNAADVEVAPAHPYPAAPGVALTADNAVTPAAPSETAIERLLKEQQEANARKHRVQTDLVLYAPTLNDIVKKAGSADRFAPPGSESKALIQINTPYIQSKPEWHPPWKLMRVISGHLGWVRAVSVDPSNQWFATGSADRTIKIWDLASGQLKLTLTGHISTVRGLVVSDRHPYLFSVSEDKEVKCWDLEVNKVVRHYHGHLSGVYCVALHPTLDVLFTGGRDAAVRAWDIRSKAQIHCLSGHTNTVASVAAQALDPQVISGSADTTIRLWDLVAGKTIAQLTNHKKSIRSLVVHPTEFTFCSGAADNLKHWKLPDAKFIKNFSGHNALVNSLALNRDDVLVSGADNGSLHFWDWKSGYSFQQLDSKPQPGSLESEAGVYAMAFDQTGSRLITCEADKSIKVWREDETATPESHPIKWNPALVQRRY